MRGAGSVTSMSPPADNPNASDAQASRAFTARVFAWLRQLLADPEIGAEFKVAFALTTFLNRHTNSAFPSHETIARLIAVSPKTVHRALQVLERRGHLLVTRGGGRHLSNTYSPVIKGAPENGDGFVPVSDDYGDKVVTVSDQKPGQSCPERVTVLSGNPDKSVPQNHCLNHKDNHEEEETVSPDLFETNEADRSNLARSDGFEEFWRLYPKKVAKSAAEKVWRSLMKAGVPPKVIVDGTRRYAAERAQEPDEYQRDKYTAHPATWLRNRRWEDESATVGGKVIDGVTGEVMTGASLGSPMKGPPKSNLEVALRMMEAGNGARAR